MQSQKLRGLVKDLINNGIYDLSREDYQRRVWFRREGPEVGSYIDSVTYFIARCDSIFKEAESAQYLGKENYVLLKKLYDSVLGHLELTETRINADELNEEELLNDPNWHDIQSFAELLYSNLKELIKEESSS